MFKKKRLLLFACVIALVVLARYAGPLFAASCLLAAIALLLASKGVRMAVNKYSMPLLDKSAHHRYEALAKRLPVEVSPDVWRFVVLGDTRNNARMTSLLYSKAKDLDPAMVFHTGDIVRAGTARELFNNHVKIADKTLGNIPLFCVPGNHERGPLRDYAAFIRLYGDDRFAFEYGGCVFAGINNCRGKGVSESDLVFLDTHLSREASNKFVFLHIPPAFFEATFVRDARRRGFKKNAEAFHEMMRRHGVKEVFMAHIHGYASTMRDSVRYTLTAGGGAPLDRRITEQNRVNHLVLLEVAKEKTTRMLYVWHESAWHIRAIADDVPSG